MVLNNSKAIKIVISLLCISFGYGILRMHSRDMIILIVLL